MEDNVPVQQNQSVVSQPAVGSMPPPAVEQVPKRKKNPVVLLLLIAAVVIIAILGSYAYSVFHEQQIEKQAIALGVAAQTDYNNGNYSAAEQKLTQAINLTDKLPNLYASLIDTIGQEGNITGNESVAFTKDAPYIKTALALYPKNVNILLATGYLNEIDGKYTNALAYYNSALAIDPNNAEGWFHKGHDLEFLGQTQNAYTAYDKAYSLDPSNGMILLAKGREAAQTAKLTDAYNYFIKATTSNSDNATKAEAYTDAGIVKRSQILYMKDAINLFKNAVTIDPHYSPALAGYGYTLSLNGDIVNGTHYLDLATKANPRISQNYYYAGIVLNVAKYYPNAIQYFAYGLTKVNQDNTIFPASNKQNVKAEFNYELAFTTSLENGDQNEILNYLNTAIQENSSYKQTVKNDFTKYHFFSNMTNNKSFMSLINS